MKFCLYDFFEEGTIEIGLTELIVRDKSFDDEDLTNELWDWEREVLVNWPSSTKQRQSGTGRGKGKGKGQQQTEFLARIVLFADDRLDQALLDKVKEMEDSDDLTTGAVTRKGRQQKTPLRYASSDEQSDEETSVKKQQNKAKRAKLTAAKETRDIDLVARLANKKEQEKKEEQNEVKNLKLENQSLKKERDALVAALACIKELPDLLSDIKETRGSSPKPFISTPRSSMSPPSTPRSSMSSPSTPRTSLSPPVKVEQTVSKPVVGGLAAPVKAIQALMSKAFTRSEMAMHSLTGSSSNANSGREARPQLDPAKMEEIFNSVQTRFPSVPNRIFRDAARNKLSNEKKLYKRSQSPGNE